MVRTAAYSDSRRRHSGVGSSVGMGAYDACARATTCLPNAYAPRSVCSKGCLGQVFYYFSVVQGVPGHFANGGSTMKWGYVAT